MVGSMVFFSVCSEVWVSVSWLLVFCNLVSRCRCVVCNLLLVLVVWCEVLRMVFWLWLNSGSGIEKLMMVWLCFVVVLCLLLRFSVRFGCVLLCLILISV